MFLLPLSSDGCLCSHRDAQEQWKCSALSLSLSPVRGRARGNGLLPTDGRQPSQPLAVGGRLGTPHCSHHFVSYGIRTELFLGLKCLDIPVPCSRVLLSRGEIELCERVSSLYGPVHAPHLPDPSVRWKRHEQRHEQRHSRGVRNGSAASCTRESHEGPSHARSTSQSKLVAHPMGYSKLRRVMSAVSNRYTSASM